MRELEFGNYLRQKGYAKKTVYSYESHVRVFEHNFENIDTFFETNPNRRLPKGVNPRMITGINHYRRFIKAQPFLPEPQPSPIRFEFRDGALHKMPPPPPEVPGERRWMAEQAWRALHDSLSEFRAGNPAPNFPAVRSVLDACLRSLGNSFDEIAAITLGVNVARLQGLAERADEILMPGDAAELTALNAQLGLFLGQFPEWMDYARGLSEGFGSPEAEAQASRDGSAALEASEEASPGIVAPDAKREIDELRAAAIPDPIAEESDSPPIIRRSWLRAVRAAVLAFCRDALSHTRAAVLVGWTMVATQKTIVALNAASDQIMALATGLPSIFGWLQGVVTHLVQLAG